MSLSVSLSVSACAPAPTNRLAQVGTRRAPVASAIQSTIARVEPPELGFYSKRLVYRGIPIKAHADVDDAALLAARDRLDLLLINNPIVLVNLVAVSAELHIVGAHQSISDLPENHHIKRDALDAKNADVGHPHGAGGLSLACREAGLLARDGESDDRDNRKKGRDSCIHEIAHAIFNLGLSDNVREMFETQFERSGALHAWKASPVIKDPGEWFSDLAMGYFATSVEAGNAIDPGGSEWLKTHDPEAFALLDRLFKGQLKMARVTYKPAARVALEREAELRSSPSQKRVRLLMRNDSREALEMDWVDYKGVRKSFGVLAPGGMAVQDTFEGYVWILAGSGGEARGLTVVGADAAVMVVR